MQDFAGFCYPAVWQFLVIAVCFFERLQTFRFIRSLCKEPANPDFFIVWTSGAANVVPFGRGFQKGGGRVLAAVGFKRAGLQKFSCPCARLDAA